MAARPIGCYRLFVVLGAQHFNTSELRKGTCLVHEFDHIASGRRERDDITLSITMISDVPSAFLVDR